MEGLKELYAKVDKLDKELEEASHGKTKLCKNCGELMATRTVHQNKLMMEREYWLDKIDQHKMLVNLTNFLERNAKEEAERKAEKEDAAFAAARTPAEEAERKAKKAKEEAEDAAKRRPIAKSNIAQKPRTREI